MSAIGLAAKLVDAMATMPVSEQPILATAAECRSLCDESVACTLFTWFSDDADPAYVRRCYLLSADRATREDAVSTSGGKHYSGDCEPVSNGDDDESGKESSGGTFPVAQLVMKSIFTITVSPFTIGLLSVRCYSTSLHFAKRNIPF